MFQHTHEYQNDYQNYYSTYNPHESIRSSDKFKQTGGFAETGGFKFKQSNSFKLQKPESIDLDQRYRDDRLKESISKHYEEYRTEAVK